MDVGYRHLSSDLSLGARILRRPGVRPLHRVSTGTSLPISARRRSRPSSSPARSRAVPRTVKALQELRVRGNLAARPLSEGNQSTLLALFMTYEYISNPILDFGAQGFQGGIVTRSSKGEVGFTGEALARFNPIAAIRSDYFVTAEGRDYDYGIGLGGRLAGSAVWTRERTGAGEWRLRLSAGGERISRPAPPVRLQCRGSRLPPQRQVRFRRRV